MALCRAWRTLFIFLLPLIFTLPLLLSVFELHQKPIQQEQKRNFPNKSDHLILGPAAGQGLPKRLQCEGLKAMNLIILPSSQKNLDTSEKVSFVSVFTVYNSSHRTEVESINENFDSKVIVGRTSYTRTERSMAILKTFINFIQVSMPRSCIFLLTDPAAELTIERNNVTLFPILGDYARGQLMLQRIRSYIVFLESRLQQKYEMQNSINHYIFTDSDVAIVNDLGHLFKNYPDFHLALTFRNNKDQPLNSGFIAVRGTPDGIRKSKIFLEEVLETYSSKYINASRMLGDQLALAWVVRSHLSFITEHFRKPEAFSAEIKGASVLFLPCAIFNWTPPEGAGQFHGMPLNVQVVHFKGSRKRLMLESWNYYNKTSSIPDMLCLILRSGRRKYDF
ncbi:uncharacterized protein LOC110109943 isoform X1 [Dendrobium catenatum]|uniref:uncharacterized protein LOC110109943 isoform X1 n=2 Tax=Dendrobium catenatum TaxID=906689 RepID=UPI0009F6E233|nr:uncharacterized protein LOC110109943 isoform X1 [Dendrobium catenatum]